MPEPGGSGDIIASRPVFGRADGRPHCHAKGPSRLNSVPGLSHSRDRIHDIGQGEQSPPRILSFGLSCIHTVATTFAASRTITDRTVHLERRFLGFFLGTGLRLAGAASSGDKSSTCSSCQGGPGTIGASLARLAVAPICSTVPASGFRRW